MSEQLYRCGRCGVCHVVERPARSGAEKARCPDCGIAFWMASLVNGKIRMGVDPRELAA
jgi:ribosomal protein S27AE